ncbi:molecular chaperone HscC [Clostridium sporogenes]|uniref:Hsp70 family protein n=1 Tax=unclassified Clostridium TaxID=2614128 RepID=UPI0013D7BF40|nr:molecular chaperone HscC [Clostridium sporogenes]NFS27112.1 molecular chaperone HscC [Clostridium sporogenes]
MAIIGIDLGTTNSLAVAYRNGKVEMIPNQFGEYLTPSVVSIDDNGKLIVGKIAKERLVTHSNQTTSLFKRNMGTSKKVFLGKKCFLPEELSALVVKQLVEDARNYLKEEIHELVISVPAYFNAKQRKATKKVGKILGIRVERLINEPSAAAIACHKNDNYETFIVFDFGGGTLDISLVDCFDNVVSITSIAGDNHLGGSDFDLTLAKYFCNNNNINFEQLDNSKKESLILNSERVKIELQTRDSVLMKANLGGVFHSSMITVDILREITMPIFNRIKSIIGRAVKDSGFSVNEINNLILVGGSSYIPIVKEYLTKLIRVPVIQTDEIDYLVAKGLGKYIGIKQRDETIKNMVVTDICPFSLSTATHNKIDNGNAYATVIIPRNTVLPASYTKELEVVEIGQREINIEVYQGEGMYVKNNLLLGSATIKVPKNLKERERFNITYSYDINSMLYIEVEIISTGENTVLTIGEDNILQNTQELRNLNAIKDISLKLNQNPQIELLIERANRIYEELDDYNKDQLLQVEASFNHVIKDCKNNVHHRLDTIARFEEILNQFEQHNNIDNLDIFLSNDQEFPS